MRALLDYIDVEIWNALLLRERERAQGEGAEEGDEFWANVRAHERRMRSEPEYAKEYERKVRAHDRYALFHDRWRAWVASIRK
ncbi:MAG: hypothetical protein Q4E13_12875 [Clostridia bacterium]|nr:hypothetical protein [Clostridia bacterium]